MRHESQIRVGKGRFPSSDYSTAKLIGSRLNIVISALRRLGISRQYSTPELAWPCIC